MNTIIMNTTTMNTTTNNQPSNSLQLLIMSELAVTVSVSIIGVFESFHAHSLLRGLLILLCGLVAAVTLNSLKTQQLRREISPETPTNAIPFAFSHCLLSTTLVWGTIIVAFLGAVIGTALRACGVF